MTRPTIPPEFPGPDLTTSKKKYAVIGNTGNRVAGTCSISEQDVLSDRFVPIPADVGFHEIRDMTLSELNEFLKNRKV